MPDNKNKLAPETFVFPEVATMDTPEAGHVAIANLLGVPTSKDDAGVETPLGGSSTLNNFAATVAPTANDDSGDGYSVGSLWIDVTGGKAYICEDATLTAAVWIEIVGTALTQNLSNKTFTDGTMIDGTADEIQLRVQAHAGQAANLVTFEDSGGNVQVSISPNGEVVINEEGVSVTNALRVESDTNANALIVRGSGSGAIGLGTTPSTDFSVEIISGEGAFGLPSVDTTTRDAYTFAERMVIYNSTNGYPEAYTALGWLPMVTTPTPYATLIDEKAANTAGGGSSAAAWQTRTIAEGVDTSGLITVSSNKFVAIVATYRIRAWLPGYRCGNHKPRLFNVTTATTVKEGLNSRSGSADDTATHAYLETTFTSNGTDEYRLDHYTTVAQGTNGLGVQLNIASTENYTFAILERLS
jgi:hypothetical protein